MRKLITFFVFFLLSVTTNCRAQTQETIIEDDQITKMIQNALFTVLKNEKEKIEIGKTNLKIDDNFYIWIDHYPAGFEPKQEILGLNMKLKYLSIYSLTKRQKKKGIYGIGFSGVRIEGNRIKLNFTGMGVHLKNNMMYVGIDGEGYLIEYVYSCEAKEWQLIMLPE